MDECSRNSALQGHYEGGTLGAAVQEGPGVVLREVRPTAIVQINGAPQEERLCEMLRDWDVTSLAPGKAGVGETLEMLWVGPGQWLAVSDSDSPQELLSRLETALAASDATLTDLSHSRTVMRVSGARAGALLSKGCPLDLEIMAPGDVATSVMGHLTVLIHCSAAKSFSVYVFRSFGLALWEWFCEEAGEFGCRLEPPETD